ncbi:MAG: RNA-binding protein, partial [Bacteroidota bacterium]
VEEAEINEMPDPDKDTFTGYVQMPYEEEAKEAISELNGEWIDGQAISVKAVQAKEPLETPSDTADDELEEEEIEIAPPKTELRRKGTEVSED